jgi:hypothetical protein
VVLVTLEDQGDNSPLWPSKNLGLLRAATEKKTDSTVIMTTAAMNGGRCGNSVDVTEKLNKIKYILDTRFSKW